MRGADLPVRAVLDRFLVASSVTGTGVLIAPAGAGKTSLLPLAMADAGPGRVLVAEPRRIATRAAARRMASLLGESLGERIGYSIRGERVIGPQCRVEVVTTGLLVQRLQRDPELPGVRAVLIDECHERHLDSDLALAFCLDSRANLRPDLTLVATSATPDTDRLALTLGGGSAAPDGAAPVVEAQVRRHPVEVRWAPGGWPAPLLRDARVNAAFLDQVAATVRRAVADSSGDVLVFLPGEREIQSVARRLGSDVAVLSLFGRQSAAEQDRALRPSDQRRIVLSTALAETSLTVPGVRTVVDAGLSREPRTDHSRGLSTLITTRVSRAAAEQRAGRAGREGPGVVYRCWSEAEHAHLAEHADPEIAVADLTGFALAVSAWGQPRGDGLALLDRPPVAALDVAEQTLRALGAIEDNGRITSRGHQLAAIGAHPRLARALLDGAAVVGVDRAAEVVAILSEDVAAGSDDLPALWRDLRAGVRPGETQRWRDEARRLSRGIADPGRARHQAVGAKRLTDDLTAGLITGLAFPERLARARVASGTDHPKAGGTDYPKAVGIGYLMAGGTGAELAAGSSLAGSEWLAVAVADRPAGRAVARVRLAVAIDAETARAAGASLLHTVDEITWTAGNLRLRRVDRLGAIALTERPLGDPDPTALAEAVREGFRSSGLELLRWSADATHLRSRLAFCSVHLGAPWPDVSDEALLQNIESWLGPDLGPVRRRSDLDRIDAGRALRRLLPWPAAGRLEELAPERLQVPTGSRVRVQYEDGTAFLSVKLQEVFGWVATPRLADGRVPVVLRLLSPAGRPVAVTADLASFWTQGGYAQVRSELRGRYPRHPWPEDPLTAEPTRRVRPRG